MISRLAQNLTFAEFVQAFSKYTEIVCEQNQSRRGELQRYLADVTSMYTQFEGSLFYYYHRQFATRAANLLQHYNTKVDWSIRDQNIYATLTAGRRATLCAICQSGLHLTDFCPQHLDLLVCRGVPKAQCSVLGERREGLSIRTHR